MRGLVIGIGFALTIFVAPAAWGQSNSEAVEFANVVRKWQSVIDTRTIDSISIELPPGVESPDQLPKAVIEDGKAIVRSTLDQKYQACMKRAAATLAIADARKAAAADTATQMTLVALGNASGLVSTCQEALHDKVRGGLTELSKRNPAAEMVVRIGNERISIGSNVAELARISQLLMAYQVASLQDLADAAQPFMTFVGEAAVDQFIWSKLRELRGVASTVIRSLPERIDASRSTDQATTDIRTVSAGLNTVIGIAFRNKPAVAANLTRHVNGLANVAQAAVTLGSVGNPVQAAMQSFGAVSALASLFLGGGGDGAAYNKLVLDQLSELRKDIETLRGEMHQRFDAIDRTLSLMTDLIEKRFTKIEDSLTHLRSEIAKMRKDDQIWQQIMESGLSALLDYQVDLASLNCFDSITASNMSASEFGKCLDNFVLYGTKVAKVDLISGGGQVGIDPLDETSREKYRKLPFQKLLGYFVFLDARLARGSVNSVASPELWSRGAAAYLELFQRSCVSPHVRAVTRETLIQQDQRNVHSLLDEGKRIKAAVMGLRKDGIGRIAQLYEGEMVAFSKALSPILERQLIKLDLGITEVMRVHRTWHQSVNGNSSRAQGCGEVKWVLKGLVSPINDNPVTLTIGSKCTGVFDTTKETDVHIRNTLWKEAQDWRDDEYPLHVNATLFDASVQLQGRYVKAIPVESYAIPTYGALVMALEWALRADELDASYRRLQQAQVLLFEALLLGRATITPGLKVQLDAVMALPVNAAGVASLMRGWPLRANALAATAVPDAVAARIKSLLVMATQSPESLDDFFPFVDRFLAPLSKMVRPREVTNVVNESPCR